MDAPEVQACPSWITSFLDREMLVGWWSLELQGEQIVAQQIVAQFNVMLRSKMAIKRKLQHKESGSKPPRKLDTWALKDKIKREQLKKYTTVILEHWDSTDGDMEQRWEDLKETLYSTDSQVRGKPGGKHRDWFDQPDMSLHKLVAERDKARKFSFQCNTTSKKTT